MSRNPKKPNRPKDDCNSPPIKNPPKLDGLSMRLCRINRDKIYRIYKLRDKLPRQEDLIVLSGEVSINELVNLRLSKSDSWDTSPGVFTRKIGSDELKITLAETQTKLKNRKIKTKKCYKVTLNDEWIGWYDTEIFSLLEVKKKVTQLWKEIFGFYLEVILLTYSMVMKNGG